MSSLDRGKSGVSNCNTYGTNAFPENSVHKPVSHGPERCDMLIGLSQSRHILGAEGRIFCTVITCITMGEGQISH